MTIRSKLLIGYGTALVVAVVIGVSSLMALLSWRESADTLSRISSQRAYSERVRAELILLISNARSSTVSESKREKMFARTDARIDALIKVLEDSSLTETENDHVQGLRETHDELVWLMRGKLAKQVGSHPEFEERLDEIVVEVTDDVDVLNQFYRDEMTAAFQSASSATTKTTYVVVSVGVASMLVLLVALGLMRRWLSTPIVGITTATAAISAGDFTVTAPEGDSDEWGALGRDINRMAESLRQFESRLRDQERLAALGEVAAYAAHNIRNPLAGVRAAAQVLQVELPQSESDSHASIAEMIESIDRLDIWVQRMMTFAKPLDYHPQSADVNMTVEATIRLSQSAIEEKRINLDCRLGEKLPHVYADVSLLEQAYSAILSNAIDAVSESGCVTVVSDVVVDDNGSSVVSVTISDNGPGVSEEMQGKLFRLFASGKDNGSGLGLAQAKRIFEAHNGSIHVENSSGTGCTVRTELPVRDGVAT